MTFLSMISKVDLVENVTKDNAMQVYIFILELWIHNLWIVLLNFLHEKTSKVMVKNLTRSPED